MQKNYTLSKKIFLRVLPLVLLFIQFHSWAQTTDGDLSMSVVAAHNLIVDSNVESPSTYAPEAVHFGVEICNNGADPISELYVNIGDYAAFPATPGIYRERTVTEQKYSGTFSLTHSGSTVDAIRYVKTLAAGKCVMQYWLVEYPRLDPSGNSVTGGSKPDDDLWLEYDIWATADDNGTQLTVSETKKATMRNEISAMANKIYPNGTNKVPSQYLDAIEEALGWRPENGGDLGSTITLEGIWFDLGNVNKGFDNDGDYVPDFNIFMQPVGDPNLYDPDCFRLVKTYGLVIVKNKGGGETLIPFEDQTYFQNIPPNNGCVGLVYYEFIALNGPCLSSLTPYQEVASGSNNEKFNGDYGVYIPSLYSSLPNATLVDTGVTSAAVNTSVEFNVTLTNSTGGDLGVLEYSLPVVMATDIPTGTEYVSGSAALNNTLPTGITATILYSTDNGVTWTATEPTTASTVTNIQWWMSDVIPNSEVVDVTFQTTIPTGYTEPTVTNTGSVALGGGVAFLTDQHTVLVEGVNSISGTLFEDDGAGANSGNQTHDTADAEETGLSAISVSIYLDSDADGVGDIFVSTVSTNGSGDFTFNNLPDGNYIVITDVDLSSSTCDGGACTGWVIGTDNNLEIDLDAAHASGTAVSTTDTDFGFLPALSISKVSNDGATVYENDLISYDISLTNNSYNTNSGNDAVTAWAETLIGSSFTSPNNVLGVNGVDGMYTSSPFTNNDNLQVSGFNFPNYTCAINSVEVVFQIYLDASLSNDIGDFDITVGGVTTNYPITTAQFNNFAPGAANVGEFAVDVTSLRSWAWTDFQTGFDINFRVDKVNADDNVLVFVDAIGVKVNRGNTTSCISPATFDNNTLINNIPLTDTYDATKLQYISASILPDVTTAGTLTWNNAMSLIPGETGVITVYFKPLEPTDLVNGDLTTNTATVTGATFLDGSAVNNASDVADVTVMNSGTITGSVWSDNNGNGWQGTTGNDVGEPLVPNVGVVLHRCDNLAGNGNCNIVPVTDTIYTDASGNYAFEGLAPNTHYQVEILETTLPGASTPSQSGDPDDDPTNGSGNGGTCGTGGANAACTGSWDNDANWFEIGVDSWGSESFDITNINFGYEVNPALQGTVWEDHNNNGTQDVGENGIDAVTIELQDGSCVPGSTCLTTTTDTNGDYSFEDLSATNYTVVVVESSLPSGGTWTETAESDGTINNTISKTLTGGEVSGGNNFAYHQTGTSTIGDIVYIDWNGDGVHDANEEGIDGVTINLYADSDGNGIIDADTDALIGTTTTSTTGAYSFTNIPAGDYLIQLDESTTPSFYSQTGDPDESGSCSTCDALASLLSVDGTSTYGGIDFGYQSTGGATMTSTVWLDANGDSIILAESSIASVTVELWADLDGDGTYTLAKSTASDADGNYTFSNLSDGNYQVKVSTTDPDLPEDAFGNPAVSTNGSSYDMTVSGAEVISINSVACTNCSDDLDFGFAKLGAIGNVVYSDANGNGAQDWSETGIAGVTVYLCDAAAGTCNSGNALQTKVTDASGNYLFTGLAPDDYTIAVDASSLGAQTADPDRDGETCASTEYPGLPGCDDQMADITLSYGTSFMGASFGYQASGVIGDFIWLDSNADGIQDAGEPGIGDVEVILTNATAVTIDGTPYTIGSYKDTVYTDLDGYYTYSDLPDGTYDIAVTAPINRAITADADNVEDGNIQIVISGGATNITNGCSDCSLDADFGYKLNGAFSLSGSICQDDGSEDGTCSTGGETMLEGTVIYLYNAAGEILGETTTDVFGNYSFENLPADTYIVAVGTTASPLNISATTTAGATTTSASVYQTQILSANVTGLDFGFKYNVNLDFGDLPSSYEVTTLDEGGAYHIVSGSPTLYLGASVDSELAPTQNADATGDATDDGVIYNAPGTWVEGSNGGSLDVTVTGEGWLVAWIDFNQDGDISDPGEMIISQAMPTTTDSTITFDVPTGALISGTSFSRVRLFKEKPSFVQFSYTGEATDGEVEDYSISFAALPVNLISFSGEEKDCEVDLHWEVASAYDFSHYVLERSADGREFEVVTIVQGTFHHTPKTYTYSEALPQSTTYYRLKMVDVDGSFSYSEIEVIESYCEKSTRNIRVFPNPMMTNHSELNMIIEGIAGNQTIQIMDSRGVLMKEVHIDIQQDIYQLRLNLDEFPVGNYFIRFKGDRSITIRFVVLKP